MTAQYPNTNVSVRRCRFVNTCRPIHHRCSATCDQSKPGMLVVTLVVCLLTEASGLTAWIFHLSLPLCQIVIGVLTLMLSLMLYSYDTLYSVIVLSDTIRSASCSPVDEKLIESEKLLPLRQLYTNQIGEAEGSGADGTEEVFEITTQKPVLPEFTTECGRTPVNPDETKIVGGYYARPYSWPWQAELCMISPFTGECYFRCGGSLIDSEWLMSAAHCVDGYTRFPEMFKMKLGAYDYRSNEEEGQLTVNIKEIHIHPSFGAPKMFSHDLSLLKIANGPINFTDHIQPVCVLRNASRVIKVGNSAYVTGWGATSEGGAVSYKLRQVRVPFLDMEECRIAYREEIDETMACAGRAGIDSCQGDSGGPLVARLEDRRWYQLGVVSWGQGCAQEGFAGVYSRPSSMCDFIENTVGKNICR